MSRKRKKRTLLYTLLGLGAGVALDVQGHRRVKRIQAKSPTYVDPVPTGFYSALLGATGLAAGLIERKKR